MPRPKPLTQKQVGLRHGFRSGLEEQIADALRTLGITYLYEGLVVPFVQPEKPRTYTTDFLLPNGIILESKGRFVTADRQKHQWVKDQHPDLDLRFIFSNSRSRISKQSATTYAKWCDSKGFLFADREVPKAWLNEPPNTRSMRAIERLLGPESQNILPWRS